MMWPLIYLAQTAGLKMPIPVMGLEIFIELTINLLTHACSYVLVGLCFLPLSAIHQCFDHIYEIHYSNQDGKL